MEGILYKVHLRVPGEILGSLRNWGFIFFLLNVLTCVFCRTFSGFSLQMERLDCSRSFDMSQLLVVLHGWERALYALLRSCMGLFCSIELPNLSLHIHFEE